MKRTSYGLLVVLLSLLLANLALADQLNDDFAQGISAERWTVTQTSAVGAPWVIEAPAPTGGLRITKPADTDATTPFVGVAVDSRYQLEGDFSVWVDFNLYTFPVSTTSWNEVGLLVGPMSVLRFTQGSDQLVEGYSSVTGLPFGEVADTSTSGRLGISRWGDTMEAWIDRGSGPVLIGSCTDPRYAGPVGMELFVAQMPAGTRPQNALDVGFNHLSILADTIVPEPASLGILALGASALLLRRRH